MASFLGNSTTSINNATTNILNPRDTAVLDAFIPGYSLLSQFLASYLQIDLTYYLPFILAVAVAAASLPYVANRLIQFSGEYLTSTAEIRLDDEIYDHLMFWMVQQPFAKRTTHFVAGTRISSGLRYWESDDEVSDTEEDEEDDLCGADGGDALANFDRCWQKTLNKDKYRPLRFTPAEGTHYFWYRGRPLAFVREQDKSSNAGYGYGYGYRLVRERLYLRSLGRDPTILKELLGEAQRAYVARDGHRTVIYRGQKTGGSDFDWVRCMARPPRPLSTVVLDETQKHAFIADIKEYLHPRTRRWYANRGIPYRRGYLLHGPPGTGKTSLCFAAAGLLGLPLYLLSLNSKSLDEDSLMSLFSELPRRCVVLLEDIDSAGITQKRSDDVSPTTKPHENNEKPTEEKESEKGVSLSGLLNVIDGVAASEGRILVMTTNHAEKLDPALLRPGRVDMTIEFGYADRGAMRGLFSAIYSVLEGDVRVAKSSEKEDPDSDPDHQVAHGRRRERIADLAGEFALRVPEGEFTAAEIQGHLLNYKNEPEAAIEMVEEWVKSVREKRKEKEKEQSA